MSPVLVFVLIIVAVIAVAIGAAVWGARMRDKRRQEVAGWAQATTYVFFEQAPPGGGDKDIMMQRIAADGSLGWAGQKAPRPFANSHDSESLPVACSDGKGGAIVAYQSAKGHRQSGCQAKFGQTCRQYTLLISLILAAEKSF